MGNISTKLNLAGLKHTRKKLKAQSGEVDCIIIPVDQNHLYKGEKGLYLDLTHIELKNRRFDSKDTHLVKQSLPKEVYNKMSEEEKKATPILGNSILWASSFSSNESALSDPIGDDDDLPF